MSNDKLLSNHNDNNQRETDELIALGNARENKSMEKKPVKPEKSKIGHRRITGEGTVTYKRKTTSEIQKALQLGIKVTVQLAHNKSKRDMLLKDFGVVETLAFPRVGGKQTPPHDLLSDFTFKTFAPIAFRYFRDFFQVDITEYLDSICHQELRELSNAGASGSIFYITCDDEFIIKTVQHKEASFLQKLLPEYYINLIQHPRTLLPKFYGLYCYQTMGKNIRFVIMNNLVPSIRIHEKYDLKGSTYKRFASEQEKSKSSPTLKDMDFRSNHNESLYLEVDTYEALMNTIQRDCRVLESFSIMDYSLLLGVHNLDQNLRTKKEDESQTEKHALSDHNHSAANDIAVTEEASGRLKSDSPDISQLTVQKGSFISEEENKNSIKEIESELLFNVKSSENSESTSGDYYCTPGMADTIRGQNNQSNATDAPSKPDPSSPNQMIVKSRESFNRQKSRSKSTRRIAAFSTVLESIQAPVEQVEMNPNDEEYIPTGGIPARNKAGDRLILFMGIIDILQSYRIMKKMEHNVKAIFLDASAISVTNPTFYAQRFQDFFANVVFKKIPSLDQPQILGSHARRFRNFVHMAMRQNPERKRASSLKKDAGDKDRQNQTREVIDESELVKDTFSNGEMPENSPTDAGLVVKLVSNNSETLDKDKSS